MKLKLPRGLRLALLAIFSLCSVSSSWAQDATWNTTTTGNQSIGSADSTGGPITIDGAVNLADGTITVTGDDSWTISGADTGDDIIGTGEISFST